MLEKPAKEKPHKFTAEEMAAKTEKHPCYSCSACETYARMHIPVAPKCNIQCNYCVRKFDCPNESRPGVTTEVLSPEEALEKYKKVKEQFKNLKRIFPVDGKLSGFRSEEDEREMNIPLCGRRYDLYPVGLCKLFAV